MDTKKIIGFLSDIAKNNNRPWFADHKDEYLACRDSFEQGVCEAISTIYAFDPTVSHLEPKDCCYRFYRDTRFSPDKSPYKRHLGAYISAKGKKSLHAGYYIHLEPGASLLAVGAYWLPTNILTSCRNEIMGNIDEWRRCVENKEFVELFGKPGGGVWTDDRVDGRGFGLSMLKTAPKDFPRDYEFLHYLRMKDYCAWITVPDSFFEGTGWLPRMAEVFKTAKPMMDFVNSVIDDYE